MEPKPIKRGWFPIVEWIVSCLIPPTYREQVLGDLTERYVSIGRYILEAAHVLPFILQTRVRRSLSWRSIIVDAWISWLSFGAVFRTDSSLSPIAFAHLIAITLVGSILRTAYASIEARPSVGRAIRDAMVTAVAVLTLQMVCGTVVPAFALPFVPVFLGTATSTVLSVGMQYVLILIARRRARATKPGQTDNKEHSESNRWYIVTRRAAHAWTIVTVFVLLSNPAFWSISATDQPAQGLINMICAAAIMAVGYRSEQKSLLPHPRYQVLSITHISSHDAAARKRDSVRKMSTLWSSAFYAPFAALMLSPSVLVLLDSIGGQTPNTRLLVWTNLTAGVIWTALWRYARHCHQHATRAFECELKNLSSDTTR